MSRPSPSALKKAPSGREKRVHPRVDTPFLAVKIDGEVYRTVNWSMGGMLIDGYGGRLTAGALLTVEALGNGGGNLRAVNIRARVTRSERKDSHPGECRLAVTYLDLDDEAYAVLAVALRSRAASAPDALSRTA